ncbi:hypothetical protein [Consotaella aegiceratis]|uniref:hypothetical protein n=1 Tax=Consotaella aegiceratis TaxID=3097961 RepID=UPI002F40690A
MERYLVIGLGKTGTTVISKTIQNSRSINRYYLEPKHAAFFENFATDKGDGVVKILFDHWAQRPRLLNSIIYNEMRTNFDKNIFITRDPRAEMISRLNYVAFPYFQAKRRSDEDAAEWIDLFRRKESDPDFSLLDLIEALRDRFGVRITEGAARMSEAYARYVGNLPSTLKSIVRYEDFVTSNLDGHPLADLFSGDRNVGEALQRTRRSGGVDDWKAFLSDRDLVWINETLSDSVDILEYEKDVERGGYIDPENCSLYVARIIAEAQKTHTR